MVVLHDFAGGLDGSWPHAPLIQAADGNFYGTTYFGGSTAGGGLGLGTIFRMTPDGIVTVLHAFVGGSDGDTPHAALVQATDGNSYGTTNFGGPSDSGIVFKMTPSGAVTVLHNFAYAEGDCPLSTMIQARDGNFYGTTYNGGGGQDFNGTAFMGRERGRADPGGFRRRWANGLDGVAAEQRRLVRAVFVGGIQPRRSHLVPVGRLR